jgi:hypothetical protein
VFSEVLNPVQGFAATVISPALGKKSIFSLPISQRAKAKYHLERVLNV